jgi:glycolate oxidase iron-sulfur subunit
VTAAEPRLGAFIGPDLPDLDGLEACVHCGICLPQCPTYRLLGEEMDSPRGRLYLMRAAAEDRIGISDTFTRHLDLCLGCRACESACPSGVPFGRILEATRGQIERRGRPLAARAIAALIYGVFPHPARLRPLLRVVRLYQQSGLQRLLRGARLLRWLPRLASMDALVPVIPRERPIPALLPAVGARRGRVGLVLGCVQRLLYPHINEQTARLLALAGYDVIVPDQQGCCGALDLHGGRLADFRRRARAAAAAFPGDLDWVVTNAAGCGSAMKEYGYWLPDDPRVGALAAKTRDVSEILADTALPLGPLPGVAAYHDPCHLAHGQKVRREPRALLARIPELRLVELADSDVCCGSAGVYNLLEPDLAERLLSRKVETIAASGAGFLVTGNPGCLLQIAKGCRARRLAVEVVHPIELLWRAVGS